MGQFGPIYAVKNEQNILFGLRCLNKKMLEEYEVV